MKLKLLQLNIEKGRFLENIVDFVKKNNIDILCFQEVTNGSVSYEGVNCFNKLKNSLNYKGVLTECWNLSGEKGSFSGNAVFFKKDLNLIKEKTVWLKPYKEIKNLNTRAVEESPRCATALKFRLDSEVFYIINTHLAWGETPEDKPYKLEQAHILYEFVKKLKSPFILCRDFNVPPSSQIIKWFDQTARNLIVENGVANTLNEKVHKAKNLFPKGLAVDYIFIKSPLKTLSFCKVDKTLSDHYGLLIQFEV